MGLWGNARVRPTVHLDVATFELASMYRLQPGESSRTCDRIPQAFACIYSPLCLVLILLWMDTFERMLGNHSRGINDGMHVYCLFLGVLYSQSTR